MSLEFAHPWLVIVAAALALSAVGLFAYRRRPAVLCFVLGAASFALAAARPVLGGGTPEVRHAVVVDVSGSMDSRREEVEAFVSGLMEDTELPAGHTFSRYELSDALRKSPAPHGAGTDFGRLSDIASDESINGEIILVTDGQGSLEALYDAVNPPRLVILKAPVPQDPDASIIAMRAPAIAPVGGSVRVRATVVCDRDAEIPWRMLRGEETVAHGSLKATGGLPATIDYAYLADSPGLVRLRLVLELPGDREPRNDSASIALMTGGRRVILYCAPGGIPPERDGLLRTLQADDRNEVRVRHELPATPRELEEAGAVVIHNLALADSGVTSRQLDVLADWTRGGGNLMMAGTGGAFGPGGYRGTPLEDIMPVRFRPDDVPERHVVLLLDASDSMDEQAGGERKIDRLKTAGTRLLESLDPGDRVAVLGFRERVEGDAHFVAPASAEAATAIQELRPQGTTYIARSLEGALAALQGVGETKDARLVMITDGIDEEGAGEESFAKIARRVKEMNVRVDIILTQDSEREWPGWMIRHAGADAVHLWPVGGDGFDDLLETLDRAIADAHREWIMTGRMRVEGVAAPLPVLVRTQLRDDVSVTPMLNADADGAVLPLLARRQMLGRSVALCTDAWGDAEMLQFWQSAGFREQLGSALSFLLQNANRMSLILNPMPDGGAELVWIADAEPPRGALDTSAGEAAPRGRGRWWLDEFPQGDELRVLAEGRLLQRIPLPEPVAHELRMTGNHDAFFDAAEHGGLRVFSGLHAWRPQRFDRDAREPIELTWLPALVAMVLLLAGFAVRRR